MKRIMFLNLLMLISVTTWSQVHWLVNADSVPDCSQLNSGRFINKISPDVVMPGYVIEFKDGYTTEFISDGKYFVKSKIEFIEDCVYESEIVEIDYPDLGYDIGKKFRTEIVQTSEVDKLVQIKSTMDGVDYNFVLERIESE